MHWIDVPFWATAWSSPSTIPRDAPLAVAPQMTSSLSVGKERHTMRVKR